MYHRSGMKRVFLLLFSAHVVTAIYPINRQLDDSNPEGVAGVDYPVYRSVPRGLSFQCFHRAAGFYADPETQCQVWHLCDLHGRKHSFLCPNRTMFNQLIRGCDWWYNVDCEGSVDLYSNNDDLFRDNRVENTRLHQRRPQTRPVPKPSQQAEDENSRWVEAVTATSRPPPRPVVTAPPPPPPSRPQQRVTFQVIRRPVTQPPPVSQPPPPSPSQFEFPDPPEQELTSSEVPDGPPTEWDVHFIASSPQPNRGIRPIPLDNSWRLPQDQERSFPSNNNVSPTFPPGDNFFASTTRTPHLVKASSSVPDQSFTSAPPRKTHPPPPPPPTFQSAPPIARISSPPFGARTTASWSSSTWADDRSHSSSASSPLPNFSSSFKPSRPFSSVNPSISVSSAFSSSSSPAVQRTPQLVFGRRTSSPPATTFDDNFSQDQDAASTAQPPRRIIPSSFPASTWRASSTPNSISTVKLSPTFRPRTSSSPIPTWSSSDDNRLDQTDSVVRLPPELNNDNSQTDDDEEERQIFLTEVQTTEFLRTFEENEVTTYHPLNRLPDSSSSARFSPASSSRAPATRTSKRKLIRTTTPLIPSTFRPTTTTTTPPPPPPPTTEEPASEPSVPLVFGARLRPKKVFRLDNSVAESNLHPSTVESPKDDQFPSKGSVYFPPEVDKIESSQDKNESPLEVETN